MSLFPRFVSQEIRPFFRLLEEPFFYPQPSAHLASRRVFQPNFDVHETKDAYELSGEVPGVNDKSKLDIQFVDAQTLLVKGKIERNRSYGPTQEQKTAENTEEASAESSSTEAAAKPPKPTVEDEAETSNSAAAASENTAVSKQPAQELKKTVNNNGPKVWVSERMSGEFQRSFSFPGLIDQEAVKASLKDGILSIVVPKREFKGSRKIAVQ